MYTKYDYTLIFTQDVVKDNKDLIYEAIAHASINLHDRYGIELYAPLSTDENIVISICIPNNLKNKFNPYKPGNKLRGISSYMYKKNPSLYKSQKINHKLLIYKLIKVTELKDWIDMK